MKKILVTGGAGLIGSHLVRELMTNQNNFVTIVDNFDVGRRENLGSLVENERLKIIEADVRDEEAMREVAKGINQIYHLAAQGIRLCFDKPHFVHEVNVTGTLNLLEASVKNNVGKFVYISSSEAYGSASVEGPMREDHIFRPATLYGATKVAGENYTLGYHSSHKLPVVIVRPFNTYGPFSHFEGAYGEVIPKFTMWALNGKPPVIHGDGNQTRDFTYVEDTAKGIMMAGESEKLIGEAVNIAYGKEVSINNIARAVLKATGREDLKPIYTEERPGDVRRHYADITKAREILGFNPKTSIEEGISKYVAWLKNQNMDLVKALQAVVKFNWRN